MNEPQPPITARRVNEWIEVSITSGLPGPAGAAGADGPPGPGAIIASVEPPPPVVDGVLWVNTGDASPQPVGGFTYADPLTYAEPPIEEVRGIALAEIVPNFTAAMPVVVNGRRYLLPLIEE